MSDPGPLKNSHGLLKAVNAYGGSFTGVDEPIIDPAEVPTMRFASIGSQPVSVASAESAPVSQAPP